MLYFEKKEKEILDVLDKFQKNTATLDELKAFQKRAQGEILASEREVDPDDNYNFLRYEKYWILLDSIVRGKVSKEKVRPHVYAIKANDFMERVAFSNEDTTAPIGKIDKPLLYFDNNTYIYLKKYVPLEKITKNTNSSTVRRIWRKWPIPYGKRISGTMKASSGICDIWGI